MMTYKGYSATVEFDDEAGIFHGRVVDLNDVITFEGESVAELRQELKNSVEDYLELCASIGKEPEKPFSGKFLVRVSPDAHRKATIAAARQGVSLNTWMTEVIEANISGATSRRTDAEASVGTGGPTAVYHLTVSASADFGTFTVPCGPEIQER